MFCNNGSKLSTTRSAAFPSYFGGIAPFFNCPAINRASAGGSLAGSVPMVMVSGRSKKIAGSDLGSCIEEVTVITFFLSIAPSDASTRISL